MESKTKKRKTKKYQNETKSPQKKINRLCFVLLNYS